MKPYEIKYHLAKNGFTPADVARHVGVARPTVSGVIRGKTVSKRIRQAISEIISIPVDEIWPKPSKANCAS